MAPITAYPGLYAEVIVDGRPLTEYNDGEETHPNTTSVYIESEADERFGVQYFIPGSLFEQYSIMAVVSIDGVTMRKYIHNQRICRLHGISRFACASSANVGNLFLGQRFRFASLDTHDEAGTVDQTVRKQLAATGNISVSFHRVTKIRTTSAHKNAPMIYEYGTVPEKALKGSAVSLKTILEPPERIAPVTWVDADHVDKADEPFALIQFKYRSAAALRSLGLIPRLQGSLPLQKHHTDQPVHASRLHPSEPCRIKNEKAPSLKRECDDDDDYEDGEIRLVRAQLAKRPCLPTDKDEVIVLD